MAYTLNENETGKLYASKGGYGVQRNDGHIVSTLSRA
jgi:hypothetical protein